MAKRTDMGKKFVKRSGKGFDQIKDLKISNDALLILKKNNNSKVFFYFVIYRFYHKY